MCVDTCEIILFIKFFITALYSPANRRSQKHTASDRNFGGENWRCLYMDLASQITAIKLDTPVQAFIKAPLTLFRVLLMHVPFTIIFTNPFLKLRLVWCTFNLYDCKIHTSTINKIISNHHSVQSNIFSPILWLVL